MSWWHFLAAASGHFSHCHLLLLQLLLLNDDYLRRGSGSEITLLSLHWRRRRIKSRGTKNHRRGIWWREEHLKEVNQVRSNSWKNETKKKKIRVWLKKRDEMQKPISLLLPVINQVFSFQVSSSFCLWEYTENYSVYIPLSYCMMSFLMMLTMRGKLLLSDSLLVYKNGLLSKRERETRKPRKDKTWPEDMTLPWLILIPAFLFVFRSCL